MTLLFLLKQKDLDLAAAEAKAASFGWGWWEHKEQPAHGVLLLESRRKPSHLALSRSCITLLRTCSRGDAAAALGRIDWNRQVRGRRYKVCVTKQTPGEENERELADLIWRSLREPKVDLARPQVRIEIVLAGASCHLGILLWENTEDFESRRAHLRPELHPSSMHPGLARALVNLACARTIHDPFCGSGGILIEAGLAHKRASGADIDPQMIRRCRLNCARFGLHPELRVADATQWMPRAQAAIADLPYGKNTRPVALSTLVEAFLIRARASTGRVIVGVPHETHAPPGWSVRAHFTIYIHKSMTKHFYVLERIAE